MIIDWLKLQAQLQQAGLSVADPEALVEWVQQQSVQNQPQDFKPLMHQLEQQMVQLLQGIIEDTQEAANQFITDIAMVDNDTERLAHQLNRVEQKMDELKTLESDQFVQRVDQQLSSIVHGLSGDMDILRGLTSYISKVATPASEVNQSIQKMMAILSFKTLMEAAMVEDKQHSFSQIAGEVRQLARHSADHSDDIIRFVDELETLINQRMTQLDDGMLHTQHHAEHIRAAMQTLLETHVQLSGFLNNTIDVFNEGHKDIWDKIRMMYAQVQFQDIVRQKAERGMTFMQSACQLMAEQNTAWLTLGTQIALSELIEHHKSVEALHASFTQGAESGEASLKIDLF